MTRIKCKCISFLLLVLVWSNDCFFAFAAEKETCEADGTCDATATLASRHCGDDAVDIPDTTVCNVPSSIYGSGGTAVAYAPNQPLKSTICGDDSASSRAERNNQYHRVATWPWSRPGSWWGSKQAPDVVLQVNILMCESKGSGSCCCHVVRKEVEIDAWQTGPDGTYASLHDQGECRARTKSQNGRATFQTVAPGSTGAMSGLGPNGWDTIPYGPPVIHILVHQTAHHSPVLVDVPILFHPHTLDQTSFWGPDFRGASWVRKRESTRFQFVSWKAVPNRHRIEVAVDVFVPAVDPSTTTTTTTNVTLALSLCPSYLYGFPSSFFLEPMSVCAPTWLDFFDL